ncbi:MAG: DUF86 domain-containing protein [Phenylobacterium sp.]|uniref:HepT-like ribonuclease domain-containing protein n=1 Tax=Phenylobacterium sp. TaxID=1871053 RepID=UPI001A4BDE81|nr:HepT-like ribonuclease domain-containing protein [Phenylobacterium sp.]MBL8773791.1 DUF86 domain-containing protein [Phenylobacterium sp.]
MTERDRSLLEDMRAFARDAVEFLGERDAADLLADKRTQYAVIRAVELVGEAASKVSADTRTSAPDLPWREAIGTRNILIHAYHELDLRLVVATVREHLPPLILRLNALLGDEPT